MKIVNILLSFFSVILFSFFSYLIYNLNLLSNRYIFMLLLIFLILLVIGILLTNLVKKKILKVLGYLILFILMIVNLIGIYYLKPMASFIDGFGKENKEKFDYYYVMTLKDSDYKKIEDLKNKEIGTIENLDDNVLKKININFNEKKYTDSKELISDLYEGKISSILISDIKEYLISEEDPNFEDKVKVIYTISIPKKITNDDSVAKKDITKEPFILYISGIDTAGKISKVSRSDVNIVVTVNPNNRDILLTSIPRDYYVRLHGTTGYKDKLTHAGLYGIDMSINTINDLLGIDIDYYARVNFDTVVNLVDIIGGIDVYSDQDLSFCNIKEGNNHLDGKCALRFARERKSYASGDRHRGENQEAVIKAIIEKMQSSAAILTKYNSIIASLENNFETNVTNDMIKEFIKLQINEVPDWDVKNLNLDGSGAKNYTYSMSNSLLYVMDPDLKTVDKASYTIKGMISGKTFAQLGL